jgi:peroxiredoxin
MSGSPDGRRDSEAPGDRDRGVLRSIGRADTDLYVPLRNWMSGLELSGTALQVGDTAPDFFLPDESARLVSLASLLDNGPVVLDFLCGSWSSFCLSKLQTLSVAVRTQSTLAAITPETGSYPRAMKAQNRLNCLVLCDVDYGVELKFGLINVVPPVIVAQMAVRGFDLAAMHGAAKPMLPAPAVYVIASSGVVTYANVDLDLLAPPDVAAILDALSRS